MPYGFYLRKNRRKFRKVAVQSNTPIKSLYKYGNPKAIIKRPKKTSFAKRVNQIISRNVENKFTNTLTYNDAVARTDAASVYTFFNWSPGADATGSKLFNLASSTVQNTRLGNTIKIKRWIIKGIIQPVLSSTTTMVNSNVGYVDVYFGKLLKNTAPPANTLINLYQNGAVANTPSCLSTDMLNPLNKDNYKVYYHRRFKMGAASSNDTYSPTPATAAAASANNDFKLSQTFGFDVCKYILKNKSLKFPDTTGAGIAPDNADVLNLTIWATFTPQTGQATGASSKTLYNIDCLTYAEYEDA